MASRERVLTTLRGGLPDRIGRLDSFWSETLARWRTEGLREDQDPSAMFGSDFASLPGPDLSFRFPVEMVEDCHQYTIQRDANGVLREDMKRESGHTPHWLDHRLKTREDWQQHRARLAWTDDRLPVDIKHHYEQARQTNLFVHFTSAEAFELAWPVWGRLGSSP